jgi:undecaprenyl pyrophosphate phosphatase UppP
MKVIRQVSMLPFAVYRVLLGVFVLLAVSFNWLPAGSLNLGLG